MEKCRPSVWRWEHELSQLAENALHGLVVLHWVVLLDVFRVGDRPIGRYDEADAERALQVRIPLEASFVATENAGM